MNKLPVKKSIQKDMLKYIVSPLAQKKSIFHSMPTILLFYDLL